MTVDSYLELFTTLFGWTFYNVLWDVLVATGVVFLPFIGILIDNWREPAEGGEFGTASSLSLRRLEIELYLALLVVVLAGQPATLTPLNATVLRYTPPPTLLEPDPATATVTNSLSTFGSQGFAGSDATINLPIWWYGVLSFTSGINHALVEGLPSMSDMRTYEQQARLANIREPRLRKEVSEFFVSCYVPARSKYQREQPDDAATQNVLDEYGDNDPDWIGSHIYQERPGYYDTLRSTASIAGWSYDANRDTEYDPATSPIWGKPFCLEWWQDEQLGLKQKLIEAGEETSAGISGLVVSIAPTWASDHQRDVVVKAVLTNAPPTWSNNELVALNRADGGIIGSVQQFVKKGLAGGGIVAASAFFSVTMTVILQSLPMVQALVLLGIYAMLPLIIVMSRFSLSMLVTAAIGIFTVKFWSVLWYVALWVDQNLIASMYPDVTAFLELFANPGEHDGKRLLLNMLTMTLYIMLPILWSGMMVWAGVKIGRSIDAAMNPASRPAYDAGRQGGALGKGLISRIGRR